jgi:hypothetical protein
MLYKIKFGKPIDKELVSEFSLLTINPKTDKELETLFVISKDGQEKSIIEDFYSSIQVKNKFTIGCLLNSPEVHALVRRTMRKLFDDVKISEQEIADIMANDIIKREIIDSEDSKKAKKEIDRIYKKLERIKENEIQERTKVVLQDIGECEEIKKLDEAALSELNNSIGISMKLLSKHIDKGLEVYQALNVDEAHRYKLPDFKELLLAKEPMKLLDNH